MLLSLAQWGDKHLQGGRGPLRFVDAETGRPLGVRVTDEYGAMAMDSDDIEIRVNSAARRR